MRRHRPCQGAARLRPKGGPGRRHYAVCRMARPGPVESAMADEREAVLRELQQMPNVGRSTAIDFYDLGIRETADFKRKNPQKLYDQLMELRGAHIDRCMLYVLRAAVYLS